MNSRKTLIALLAALLIGGATTLFFLHWRGKDDVGARMELLKLLPGDPNAVCFADLKELRNSEFFEQLIAAGPQQPTDADYTQFVQATDFHYERDLDRAAMAVLRDNGVTSYLIIADGRFDRKKIEAYAQNAGTKQVLRGKTIFSLPPKSSSRGPSFFTFLREDRIAWTNDPAYAALLLQETPATSPAEWRERFTRLAGTPVFALMRQDAEVLPPLAQQALQSPELATLLGQLQWISIAGKPDGNLLRIVVEAESVSQQTIRQLTELLNGAAVMATIGLNDAKTRKALDPQVREAYLDLLKTASVDNVDRGDTKSARIVLEVTPSLLRTLGDAGASGHLAPQKENGEQPPDRNVGKPNVGKKPRKNQSPAAPPRM